MQTKAAPLAIALLGLTLLAGCGGAEGGSPTAESGGPAKPATRIVVQTASEASR